MREIEAVEWLIDAVQLGEAAATRTTTRHRVAGRFGRHELIARGLF